MKIGIDVSPLSTNHSVRGIGSYTENLKKSLTLYYSPSDFVFFNSRLPKDENVDVIHYPFFDPFFLSLPFSNSLRTVVTVHDLIPLVFPSHFPVGIKGKIKWNIQKLMLKKTAHIITDSVSSKKDIVRLSGIDEDRISVIYLAAGTEYKKKILKKERVLELREKYNLPDKFILYVGDATWNKNLPRLVKAAQAAGVPLVLVGKVFTSEIADSENVWNKDLVEVAKLAKENKNVIKTGFVEENDLVDLYNIAKVFIMPSLYEGFGLPVLEAMQSGCPVITTQEGSLKEVAGQAAHFVDPYSISSITDGIKAVYFSKNLQEALRKEGSKQAEKFSWKKTAEQTLKVYEKVFSKK